MNTRKILVNESIGEVYVGLIDICKSICNNVRIDKDNYRIQLITKASLFSYGEKIEIHVSKKNHKTLITIEGAPVVFFNITADSEKYLNLISDKINNKYTIII